MAEKKDRDDKIPHPRFEDDNLLGSGVISDDAVLPSPSSANELHEQIDILTKALKEAEEKAQTHWDRLLRKEAEYQNLQRRMQQDVENTRKFAIERFAQEILQVLDSLDQGLHFSEEGKATLKDLQEGVALTHSLLINALDKQGIQLINPAPGEVFNPSFHEAISMQETQGSPPNSIVTVVQKGYQLNNRLLRPARVVVSRASTM